MSGTHFSAGDETLTLGVKVRLGRLQELTEGEKTLRSWGEGEGEGNHMWERFFFFEPPLLVTAGGFSQDAFKVAPVQPGVGVTEGLMWAQSAL